MNEDWATHHPAGWNGQNNRNGKGGSPRQIRIIYIFLPKTKSNSKDNAKRNDIFQEQHDGIKIVVVCGYAIPGIERYSAVCSVNVPSTDVAAIKPARAALRERLIGIRFTYRKHQVKNH